MIEDSDLKELEDYLKASADYQAIHAFTKYVVDSMDISTLRDNYHSELITYFHKIAKSCPKALAEIMNEEDWDVQEYYKESHA